MDEKNKQPSLFEENTPKIGLDIIFKQKIKTTKTKGFDEVAKKIEKINTLKAQIAEKEKALQNIKLLHNKYVHEQEQIYYQAKELYVIILVDKYFEKGYTKWQQDMLYKMFLEEVELLSDMGYTSAILEENITKVNQHYVANVSALEKDMAKEMLNSFMKNNGFEMGDKDFSMEDFTNPDFVNQFTEHKHKQHFEEQKNQNEQQIANKNLNTDIDFQKIYKKLIKLVHPDLFKSEDEKLEKEKLIKEVTAAWENRDYLQLLVLKEIIDPNNSIDVALSEKNLKSIIKQLNEEIKQLETEKYMFSSHYGQNYFYFANFNAKTESGIIKKIEAYKKTLQDSIILQENHIHGHFKNKSTTKKFLTELYDSTEDAFDSANFFDDF